MTDAPPSPDCPDPGALARAHARPARHREIVAHVHDGCPSCAGQWRQLDLRALTVEVDPAPALLPARPGARRPDGASSAAPLEGLVELVAALVWDSRDRPVDVRGPAVPGRHLILAAGGYEIDVVHIEGGRLVGQILALEGDPFASGAARLTGEGVDRAAALEVEGDFRFGGVVAGRYALVIEGEGLRLVVPELDLRAAAL